MPQALHSADASLSDHLWTAPAVKDVRNRLHLHILRAGLFAASEIDVQGEKCIFRQLACMRNYVLHNFMTSNNNNPQSN